MSELRTEARLLLDTIEARLLTLRSLVPTADVTDEPIAPVTGIDPAPTCAHCGAAGTSAGGRTDAASAHAPNSVSCKGCPLCTMMAVLRGERPDLAGALLDGAVTALQLARSLVAEEPVPGPVGHGHPRPADTQRADTQPADSQPADTQQARPTPSTTDPASPAAAQRRPPERIRIS